MLKLRNWISSNEIPDDIRLSHKEGLKRLKIDGSSVYGFKAHSKEAREFLGGECLYTRDLGSAIFLPSEEILNYQGGLIKLFGEFWRDITILAVHN